MNPLVSICIPTYNGAKFIAEAMDSAIAQTYTNLEIVVSDDASTDDTLHIIETYKSKTEIPIHIYHHQPDGIGANWNHCIQHAQGEYIKFLFQDDVLMPKAVEFMFNVLESNKKVGLVACKREFIISNDLKEDEFVIKWIRLYGDLQTNLEVKATEGVMYLDKSIFKTSKFWNWPFNKIGEPSTYLFRKELINSVGFFREDLRQILDYEFCYRTLKQLDIAIIIKPLCKFRIHKGQATQKNRGHEASDFIIYHSIILKDYFWLLNRREKLRILRSNFALIDFLFKTKGKVLVALKSYFN